MGIWGTIAKGLVSAIPIVGPIIEGGIEAATAKKAANQQVAGGQRAMDIQNKVYQQQQQLMQPYYETGTNAFTTLGSLLGLPGGGGGAPMPQMGQTSGSLGGNPFGSLPNDTQQGAMTDPAVQPNAAYNQGGDWVGMLSQQQRAAMPQSTTSYSTPQQHGSSVSGAPQIRMKAPSGEEELVPADQVAHYLQQGATVMGSA